MVCRFDSHCFQRCHCHCYQQYNGTAVSTNNVMLLPLLLSIASRYSDVLGIARQCLWVAIALQRPSIGADEDDKGYIAVEHERE